jgi:uncharacterized protein (TIGR00290 family)
MPHKSIFNWSGGKDSALALYYARQHPEYNIERLVTSVNAEYNRISMHGVRVELLEQQAVELGLPLLQLRLKEQPTMDEYNEAMGMMMTGLRAEGFTHSVFGDIFLEDLRRYRENKLSEAGFTGVFPLWKRNTADLIREFIDLGFKTITTCVNAEVLDKSFVGRCIDDDFLRELPAAVGPCGENGEFHTFVFDGPIFKNAIPIHVGETVFRQYHSPHTSGDQTSAAVPSEIDSMGFWFCDVLNGSMV